MKFKFRPYYAYDCDSEMGFNNGHYLAEVTVTAPDEEAARKLVLEILAGEFAFDTVDADETCALDVAAAWTFDHVYVTEDGTPYSDAANIPTDPDTGGAVEYETRYLYKYLDLGEAVCVDSAEVAK